MDLFVIDLDDPRERWEELYDRVREALADPRPTPHPEGLREDPVDPLELLHVAYWNGA